MDLDGPSCGGVRVWVGSCFGAVRVWRGHGVEGSGSGEVRVWVGSGSGEVAVWRAQTLTQGLTEEGTWESPGLTLLNVCVSRTS